MDAEAEFLTPALPFLLKAWLSDRGEVPPKTRLPIFQGTAPAAYRWDPISERLLPSTAAAPSRMNEYRTRKTAQRPHGGLRRASQAKL